MSIAAGAERSVRTLSLLVSLAAVSALLAPAELHASTSAEYERILERYRPVLRYDAQERYFAQPVSLPPKSAEVVPADRVYGHIAREGADTWLQYWLFYADNPQDRSPLGTGTHEGDWELIQLRLGSDGVPDVSVSSQHSWAEACGWDEVEMSSQGGPSGPVYFVANGSHAIYSRAGDYDRPFPDPTDEAGGDGPSARPELEVIEDGDSGWVDYEGRWGETEAGIVPGESSSPYGPRFQESEVWDEPTSYYSERARECGTGPPGRPLQTAAVVLLVVGGVGALAYRRFRRSRSPDGPPPTP